MYERNRPEFNNLVEIIDALAETRAKEFAISFQDMNMLDKLVSNLSIKGEIPSELGTSLKEENLPNDIFMCIEGQTCQPESENIHPASIQWGSEGNSSYIHLEFLGFNFLMMKSQGLVFSHDKHRNLWEREISNIVKMFRNTSWGLIEFKTMDQILKSKNSIDPS